MNPDRRPTIFVIDDDAGIAGAIKQVLSLSGFRSVFAASCKDAAEVIDDAQFLKLPIHGVLTDVRLPDGLGYKLIDLFRLRYPDVPVAVMTAYADEKVFNWLREQKVPFLQKPFRVGQLTEWLQTAKTYAESHPAGVVGEEESWRLKLA